MNTPQENAIAAAEHTIAMMLSISRKIPQATSSMRGGKWEKKKFMGVELYNKTLGLVGIGVIGTVVADRARGLKMKVVGYDPYLSPEVAEKKGVDLVSLDELLARADFISVHTPLTDETRSLIDKKAMAKMKKGVILINCARGGIINEKDLYEAIKGGKVAGAALDVFEKFGITVAGGQDQAKGKIIRIAHLGYYERLDMVMVISALEMLLREMGYSFELGAGVRAAEVVLME